MKQKRMETLMLKSGNRRLLGDPTHPRELKLKPTYPCTWSIAPGARIAVPGRALQCIMCRINMDMPTNLARLSPSIIAS